jgi:hypothetical protein
MSKSHAFQAAHRDILATMSFCVGSSTPGAYIEELLIALPSIRALVDARGDWEFARAETWEILFDSLVGKNALSHVSKLWLLNTHLTCRHIVPATSDLYHYRLRSDPRHR